MVQQIKKLKRNNRTFIAHHIGIGAMIVRCSVGLCILFNLILLCQGRGKDGLGFGYQESEEEDPNRQNVLVRFSIFDH